MRNENNNGSHRTWIKKDGLTIKTDYNSDKELVGGYMTNGKKEIHISRVNSGWCVFLDYKGKHTRIYEGLTKAEMLVKWDKKLVEFKKTL